ncbi:DUF378 domain-containing protein [Cohnella abietis]|uniref:DUF378 domain-containing protein n=1 Tax=Cohnella abietis TaxID=2507935 RepID=A0A3T1D955_9BACL|nr:DUF378 domain-containing protein [Cohnella abietis]BBI34613.1 DUF378 domain-containing protein [Cohnella abietis]
MKILNIVALALLIIGGVNWLLIGLFEYDLVAGIFGKASRVIFTIVGICALYALKFFNDVGSEESAR